MYILYISHPQNPDAYLSTAVWPPGTFLINKRHSVPQDQNYYLSINSDSVRLKGFLNKQDAIDLREDIIQAYNSGLKVYDLREETGYWKSG